MKLHLAFLSLLLASHTGATPAPKVNHVVHEKRIEHLSWKPTRRLDGHVTIPLRIGLRQQNLETLPELIMSVSDPGSSSYGQHWSPENITKEFAPADRSSDVVRKWLADAGFNTDRLRLSHNKAWIDIVNATVREAEDLLSTEYHIYSRDTGEEDVGCHSYIVPRHVSEHIEIITPTVQPNIKLIGPLAKAKRDVGDDVLGKSKSKRATLTVLPGCDEVTTPDCLRSLYNISYTPQATSNNSFAHVNTFPNTYLQSDLDMFFANVSPALVGKSPVFVSIDGGTVNDTNHGEANGILQYAMVLTQPQPVTFMKIGDPSSTPLGAVSFNEWLDAVDGSYCTSEGGDDFYFDPQFPNPAQTNITHSCGIIHPPNVITVSKADDEHRLTPFYTQRQCQEFGKLALMGVSVLYPAGDLGVAGSRGYCLDENGSMNLNATNFNPTWPSSCPWITSIGGTQLKPNASATDPDPEEVWNGGGPTLFASGGGGFSNRFPTPDYQKTAVTSFVQALRKSEPAQLSNFNTKGRGFPDFSVIATSYAHAVNGVFVVETGTSLSGPVAASMITLINDARIAAGKKPVGFINPTIYSPGFSSAFRDITTGVTTGCKGLQGVSDGGFRAGPGWDAASGLGTPNFPVLMEKWLALP